MWIYGWRFKKKKEKEKEKDICLEEIGLCASKVFRASNYMHTSCPWSFKKSPI
jgi:hypothetical protein